MNIDEKIKELEEKLEEISKEIEELEKRKENFVRMRCSDMGLYYYLDSEGDTHATYEDFADEDTFRFSIGNYFKTEKQVELYRENLITHQQLKDIAMRLNNGKEIVWENGRQDKNYIVYDNHNGKFSLSYNNFDKSIGTVYCLDKNFLQVALSEIGEEKLKQLLERGI